MSSTRSATWTEGQDGEGRTYRERLVPPLAVFILVAGLATMLGVAYGAAYGSTLGWAAALVLGGLGVAALLVTSTPIHVDDRVLRAGRARLPLSSIAHAAPLDADQRALLARWDRIGLGVRLAYNPSHPQAIRAFLHAGRCLASSGARTELDVQARTLGVLLDTALDPALPLPWRSACVEHACLPFARLVSLARRTGRVDAGMWQRRIDDAERRLADVASCADPDRD